MRGLGGRGYINDGSCRASLYLSYSLEACYVCYNLHIYIYIYIYIYIWLKMGFSIVPN